MRKTVSLVALWLAVAASVALTWAGWHLAGAIIFALVASAVVIRHG